MITETINSIVKLAEKLPECDVAKVSGQLLSTVGVNDKTFQSFWSQLDENDQHGLYFHTKDHQMKGSG